MPKKFILFLPAFLFTFIIPQLSYANSLSHLQLKTDFNIWKVNLNRVNWMADKEKWLWNDFEVILPQHLIEDDRKKARDLLSREVREELSYEKIADYLNRTAAPDLHREKQDVSIFLNAKGEIQFEGFAISGQEIDFNKAYHVIKSALAQNESEVRLPLHVIEPQIKVDGNLKEKGITHLLATGETDFSGSPANRINNIKVGLNSFNGQLIPPDKESGAGEILGEVDETTGYKKELVIKGDKTIPEYGGGLCQVSTTVYRSLLFAGIPITQRRNHSYAVSYYDPQGLDATIYPPYVDMKFKNDTPGHLLIQTMTTEEGKAYSNIYGTPTHRQVELIGPYYYAHKPAPPPRVEYTDQLPAGETQKLGGAHDGFKASWYRRILYRKEEVKEEKFEHIFSSYEARPFYTLIGGPPPKEEVGQPVENKTASN